MRAAGPEDPAGRGGHHQVGPHPGTFGPGVPGDPRRSRRAGPPARSLHAPLGPVAVRRVDDYGRGAATSCCPRPSISSSITSPGARYGNPRYRDPLRGAGDDEVTGLEDQVLREVPDQVADAKDLVGGRRVLVRFAVDP